VSVIVTQEQAPQRGVLMTTSLVSSLIMLDSNIVAVALPTIARSLNATFTDVQWVISAYVLTYAALLLAAGNYADLRGRRKAMLLGLGIFAASSALCGIATTPTLLNTARAIQGVGGALLLTASLAILSHSFVGAARTRAFAFWGASLGVALAIGPLAGGLITNHFGWRWVFLVNVPACAILIAATLKFIEESSDPSAKRLDVLGILTFGCGLAALIWALIDGNDAGWSSRAILIRLAAAAVLLALFVIVELRQPRPMVDFALFRNSTFLGAVLAMIGYGASAQVMVFFLPQFLQNSYAFDPFTAGVGMLPFALPMIIVPRITSRVAGRVSGRMLLTSGLVVAAIGNVLFWAVARAALPYTAFVSAMLVAGAAAGVLNGQTVKVLQNAVSEDRVGMASGIASTTRFIGILVSVAALGAVISQVAAHTFVQDAVSAGLSQAVAEAASRRVISGDVDTALPASASAVQTQLHLAAEHAYASGFSTAALVAALFAIVSGCLAFRFVRFEDTQPAQTPRSYDAHCMVVDCRHPL
jgi:EmrB/QacA subfamily drug resistance transporter